MAKSHLISSCIYSFICINLHQSQILEALGATVERVRPVSITHKDHFVNIARRRATEANELASRHEESNHILVNGTIEEGKDSQIFPRDCKGGFFADQFENLANFRSHYEGTGPEIWEQTNGKLHAFVAAAGTGGTIAGVSRFLQVCTFIFMPSFVFLVNAAILLMSTN